MSKAELVITSSPDDAVVDGHCSSCPNVKFTVEGNQLHHKVLVRGLFDQHYKRVHLRENDSASRPDEPGEEELNH